MKIWESSPMYSIDLDIYIVEMPRSLHKLFKFELTKNPKNRKIMGK